MTKLDQQLLLWYDEATVRDALSQGANPNVQDPDSKQTPLHIVGDTVRLVRQGLTKGDPYQEYPRLMTSACLLLEAGANPDLKDVYGRKAIDCFPQTDYEQLRWLADSNRAKARLESDLPPAKEQLTDRKQRL